MKQHHLSTFIVNALAFVAVIAQGQTPPIPMAATTRVTTNTDGAVTVQSVERVQLKNGQFADWRTSNSVTRETKPGCTETTETIIQSAIPGFGPQTIQRATTQEKTATGETTRTTEVTRNAFGKDTGQRVIEEITQREPDGTTSVRVVEQAPDPHGQLAVQREEQRRIRELNQTTTVIENRIRSYDNLRGRFDLTAIQTTEIQKKGDATQTETTTRRTVADQDRVVGRVLTTETKARDGSSQREIIEYGQGLFDKVTYMATGELKQQRRIVERSVPNADGTSSLKRDVFRLDVNGDWKPVPYNWAGNQP